MNIKEISGMENEYQKFIGIYNERPQDVVLYGGGAGADWAIRLLKNENIYPSKIIDNGRSGQQKEDISIIDYDTFKKEYAGKDVYIIIASPRYKQEIYQTVCECVSAENVFCFECELYCNYIHDIENYRRYLLYNEIQLNMLYDRLEDDMSRRTLENVLKGRVSGNIDYFQNVCVENQYFPKDIVKLNEQETFCDVGAFTGDTVAQIVKITSGKYKKIFCFEPDEKCCEQLYKNTMNLENITIIKKGAWNQAEKLYICDDSDHGSSKINDEGKYSIETDCIDNCIPKETSVTHIKMDVEGSELNALKGAERVIKENEPILAICVYHKIEDFVEISDFILSVIPNYKLYLRHHNISGTETVLYAVPQSMA